MPDEALPAIGEFFPRFRLADVDSGHWVISEKPEEFRRGTFCSSSLLLSSSPFLLSGLCSLVLFMAWTLEAQMLT